MYQGRLGETDWTAIITHAVDTAASVIRPGYSQQTPTGTTISTVASNPGIWLLGGLAVVLLLSRKG